MNKRIRKKQLKKIGKYVPVNDTWGLDITIAEFVLPRLKLFRKVVDCFPCDLNTIEEWYDILDKMIESFRMISISPSYKTFEERKEVIEEGLDLFRKYYHDLWW